MCGFWRETQKRTDLKMKWVLIIDEVRGMRSSERKRGCVNFFFFFFFVWAKGVGFVKWVLGVKDLAKENGGYWGLLMWRSIKEWRSMKKLTVEKNTRVQAHEKEGKYQGLVF